MSQGPTFSATQLIGLCFSPVFHIFLDRLSALVWKKTGFLHYSFMCFLCFASICSFIPGRALCPFSCSSKCLNVIWSIMFPQRTGHAKEDHFLCLGCAQRDINPWHLAHFSSAVNQPQNFKQVVRTESVNQHTSKHLDNYTTDYGGILCQYSIILYIHGIYNEQGV